MDIEIFSLKYLQFIFSNVWVWIGFLIFLLIITSTFKRIFSPLQKYFITVKQKIKDYERKEKIIEKVIKEQQPLITKK